jgi:peptidyl-prolyl cis-trans isomerase D
MQQAFALNKGGETEGVEEAAPGEYYAIRVESVSPAAPLTIEEIRAPVTQRLMQQDMIKRVQAKSEELADKVRKGMTIEAAAASIGASVQNASLARGNQQAAQALGQEFMAAVFGAKTGQVVTAPTQTGIAVIRLETPAPAPVQLVAQVAAQQRAAVSASTGQDFSAAVRLAARSVIKPRVDLKRARAAAGGDPATVVNPGDKGTAKPDPAAAKPDPAKAAKPAA